MFMQVSSSFGMELGVELDVDFGARGGEAAEAALSPAWREAALRNINDDEKLRPKRIK